MSHGVKLGREFVEANPSVEALDAELDRLRLLQRDKDGGSEWLHGDEGREYRQVVTDALHAAKAEATKAQLRAARNGAVAAPRDALVVEHESIEVDASPAYDELAFRASKGDKAALAQLEKVEHEHLVAASRRKAAERYAAQLKAEADRKAAAEARRAEEERLAVLRSEYAAKFGQLSEEFATIAQLAGEVIDLGLRAWNRNIAGDVAGELGNAIQRCWVDKNPKIARYLRTEFGTNPGASHALALAAAEAEGQRLMAENRRKFAEKNQKNERQATAQSEGVLS